MKLWIQRGLAILTLSASLSVGAAELRDRYADRETVTDPSGRIEGDNTGATVEPEEPRHGDKRPSHSLWLSWIAPANGLATLRLVGRGFDTLLGVYEAEDDDDDELDELERVAGNDDDRDAPTSLVQFGVRAGQRYEIAVDGFAGATGVLALEWNLETIDALIPRITLVNGDRAATLGETITLAITLGPGDEPDLHWFFNDQELEDEEEATLTIPNFQAENVGHYRVRIEIGDVRFFSDSIELQVSSEGIVTALARNKPEDALDSPLQGAAGFANPAARLARAGAELTRGYNGTQIFHTVYAGRDVNEPLHCGVGGGASYWFAYSPPATGALELDTDGSAFDTVLAVYSYDPPLLGYTSLRSVDCDNDSGANGRTSRLRVPCEVNRPYLIVVDGVAGARGLTYLNYRLDTNTVVAVAPKLGPPQPPITAAEGGRVVLKVDATGTAPLSFQWVKESTELPAETNHTLTLDPVRLDHGGTYSVRVSNSAGAATLSGLAIGVWRQPLLAVDPGSFTGRLQFAVSGNMRFTVMTSSNSIADWIPSRPEVAGATPIEIPVALDAAAGFFQVRFE